MNLNVTTIQCDLAWEDKQTNLNFFEKALDEANEDSKLVVLPEMFSTAFSMNPKQFAEPMNGNSVNWMQTQAKRINKHLVGSLIIEDQGEFYNRLIVASPNGELNTYDKKHLFRYANENEFYNPGNNHLILDFNGVKVAFFICYDLRFPVWSRNSKLKYDAAVYIANWPEKRREHWMALLKARAIENQAYVIGVNRIGNDGNGISHSGDSTVFSPLGEKISTTQPHESKVENVRLDIEALQDYRAKFPAYLDADDFSFL